ncbi:hypothetical protein [Pseudochrobactrum sp. MP213Fo]|uniref:hypothetical protein n=1 Tax=Pseudochrobactrum sp. MP213Fo TaxID=3022250 RepID=UPI003BA02F62
MFIDARNNKMAHLPPDLSSETDVYLTKDDPLIAYKNYVTRANVSASSAELFNPAVNLANPSTYLKWKAAAAVPCFIKTMLPDMPVDYVGIARHNLGTAGVSISITAEKGGTTIQLLQDTLLTSDEPVLVRVERGTYESVSVALSGGSIPQTIAVLYVGELLTVPHGIPTGYTPLKHGVKTEVVSGKSQSGEFLGRRIISEGTSTSIPFQQLNGAWYRMHLAPAIKLMRTLPFFFAWSPRHYPEETGFCWTVNDPRPTIDDQEGRINVTLEVAGLTK